jgi:hypothetical protein
MTTVLRNCKACGSQFYTYRNTNSRQGRVYCSSGTCWKGRTGSIGIRVGSGIRVSTRGGTLKGAVR